MRPSAKTASTASSTIRWRGRSSRSGCSEKRNEFSWRCQAGKTVWRSGMFCSRWAIAPMRSMWTSASEPILKQSHAKVTKFAEAVAASHGATLHLHTVEQEAGAGIKELAQLIHRPTCSTCGTIKRYQFNRVAIEQKYDVMATGHNLDDEAARLLGNVLHWQEEYLDKQGPSLPASVAGFAKKVKPLFRLSERELRGLCGLEPDRLHRRRMPHGERLQDAPVQGGLESSGDRVAWHKTDLLLGLSR